MDDLIRLTVTVPGEEEELLCACLAMHVPYGWEEDTLPTGETRALVYAENEAFLAELRQALFLMLPGAVVLSEAVPRKDWTLAWREFFTPVEAGSRFLVLAPWMEDSINDPGGRIPLIIEPKTAFGTGHHASTALCLKAVSDLADAGRIRAGMEFLDLGTGTGILGLACVQCGLHGTGLDIDMLAVENSRENAALNGIATTSANPDGDTAVLSAMDGDTAVLSGKDGDAPFRLGRGSIDDAEGPYDVILANILARPLMDMADAITARLKPGGVLVLSGILEIQAGDVAEKYMACGLPAPEKTLLGEWASLVWS